MHRYSFATAVLACLVAVPALAQLRAPAPPPPPSSSQGAPAGPGPSGPSAAPSGAPQQDPLTREFRECTQKAQAAMQAKQADDPDAIMACLSAEIKRQDGRLATNVGRLTKLITAEDKKRLDDANAAWRRFRDANCLFFADPKGAPPINLRNADCRLNITVGRVLELDQLVGFLSQRPSGPPGSGPAAPGSAPAAAPAAPAGDTKQ